MSKELSKKNSKDLEKDLDQKVISLRDLRFGSAHSKSRNVKEYQNTKREIARIKTAMKIKN